MEKLAQIVGNILNEYFCVEIPQEEWSKPFESFDLDLLDQVDLIMQIEEKCNISIPDNICEEFTCINDIVLYLNKINK